MVWGGDRMRARRAYTVVSLALMVLALGCRKTGKCPPMMAQSDLVARAELLRLEVYAAAKGAHCDGAQLATGGPAPERATAGPPGSPLDVDVPTGHQVLVLSAYRAGGAMLIGSACSEVDVKAGEAQCYALDLVP